MGILFGKEKYLFVFWPVRLAISSIIISIRPHRLKGARDQFLFDPAKSKYIFSEVKTELKLGEEKV